MEYGGSQIMEKLMNILMEIDSSIAWDKEEKLIDDRIMDSFMDNIPDLRIGRPVPD